MSCSARIILRHLLINFCGIFYGIVFEIVFETKQKKINSLAIIICLLKCQPQCSLGNFVLPVVTEYTNNERQTAVRIYKCEQNQFELTSIVSRIRWIESRVVVMNKIEAKIVIEMDFVEFIMRVYFFSFFLSLIV